MARTISATSVRKHFKDVLDAIERGGETFEVVRRGRVVARIAPTAPVPRRVTLGEALEAIRRGPAPDEGFASDLADIRASARSLPQYVADFW